MLSLEFHLGVQTDIRVLFFSSPWSAESKFPAFLSIKQLWAQYSCFQTLQPSGL